MAEVASMPGTLVLDRNGEGFKFRIIRAPVLAGIRQDFPNLGAAIWAAIVVASQNGLAVTITREAILGHMAGEILRMRSGDA